MCAANQIFFPMSRLRFYNMNITLNRVEDCSVFVEKIQISHVGQRKAVIDRKGVLCFRLSEIGAQVAYKKSSLAICFTPVR